MNFLLQKNIWQEYAYDKFVSAIENDGHVLDIADLIPFTSEFKHNLSIVPDYCFGSTRFINVCREKGFPVFPTYIPNKFEMFPKEHWINSDGFVCKYGELKIERPCFIKPFTEKFFTGTIVESSDCLQKIQLSTSFCEDENEELVFCSPIKHIKEEIRLFVIGGQIVTGSIYKRNGIGTYQVLPSYHVIFEKAKNLLRMADYLDAGFVLDMGLVDDEWKIVELNNLNSAGLYLSDVDAIVRSLKFL